MTVELGLFDIKQVDPVDPDSHGAVYERRLRDLELADELGLKYAFTAERHFMGNYRCPAPNAWLAAATQRTTSIRLGVLAYTLPLHLPTTLAEEIAVVDILSGGRLEVGLGLGHRPEELVALGIDPSQRIQSFQERLGIMEGLWSGSQVTIESPLTVVRSAAINPLPVQKPHPPLWFAGGDPVAAEWAASRGMSLAIGFKPAVDLLPSVTAFQQAAQLRATQPDHQAISGEGRIALMRHVYVAGSDHRAIDEMTDDLYRLHSPNTAAEGSRADRKQEARAAAGKLIADEIFFAGSPETVTRAILREKGRLGISVFLANIYSAGVDDERIHRMLELLAGEITAGLSMDARDTAAITT